MCVLIFVVRASDEEVVLSGCQHFKTTEVVMMMMQGPCAQWEMDAVLPRGVRQTLTFLISLNCPQNYSRPNHHPLTNLHRDSNPGVFRVCDLSFGATESILIGNRTRNTFSRSCYPDYVLLLISMTKRAEFGANRFFCVLELQAKKVMNPQIRLKQL